MRKLALLVGFMVIASASSAAAAGYGSAGCGWGGDVVAKKHFWGQFGALLLNGVSSNQTFAMTSGTSGCKKALGAVLAQQEQQKFVEGNFTTLSKEMAAGEGEHLSTLAGLMGCSTESVGAFGAFTQVNFSAIVQSPDTSASELLGALKTGMSRDQRLSASCSRS
jgi:hypothetical protein